MTETEGIVPEALTPQVRISGLGKARRAAESLLPRLLPSRMSATLLAIAERCSQYRRYRNSPSAGATKVIEAELGLAVRNGPFRGMSYPRSAAYSRPQAIPKLLGCYEKELHESITTFLVDRSYRRFVDIGAAEGYYAVGFALAGDRPVYAFEIEPFERWRARLMARLNGVQHLVHLEGWCSPEKLRATCPDRSLILCDCEGYETTLFTESLIRSLCHSDLIIELHDDVEIHFGTDRTVTRNDFLSRFAATHQINLITSVPRLAAECPELVKLGLLDDLLVNEFRTVGQQWAIITARSSSFL